MPKYAKNARVTQDVLDKMVVQGKKGFATIGDEPLSRETIVSRLPISDMEKLKEYLEKKDLTKSQWAREVLTAAIADLE